MTMMKRAVMMSKGFDAYDGLSEMEKELFGVQATHLISDFCCGHCYGACQALSALTVFSLVEGSRDFVMWPLPWNIRRVMTLSLSIRASRRIEICSNSKC